MWRCAGFSAAVLLLGAMLARGDYLHVKVDLGHVYQHIPTGGGVGPGAGAAAFPIGPKTFPGQPVAPEGPFVSAIIEMKSKPKFEWQKGKEQEVGGQTFDHPWGRSARFPITPALSPAIIKYTKITRDPPAKEFEKTFKKELATNKDIGKYLNAANWALRHGLIAEFKTTMDDLGKFAPKTPAVVNYQRVNAALRKPPATEDPTLKPLIGELTKVDAAKYHWVAGEGGYYVALTNLPTSFDSGVKRRLARLHETMESFYYWFALHNELPQPELPSYRQLLVVTSSTDEFYVRHAQFGSPPFTGDGVTTRRDNFILMSWRPLAENLRTLDHNNQDLWKKLDLKKDMLISGAIWDKNKITVAIDRDPFPAAFAQTLTLVQKALEDEMELATLSREGVRQLLFASGILPRQVHTPEWVAQGLASYFETPPGAVFRGIGQPSWSNLISFKYFRVAKKFDRPADVLTNVYTDRYYRTAQKDFGDLADATSKDRLNDRLQEQMDLANCTAWAFTYYIIERKRQPQLLFRYCQELNSLPRDLDLDERALEACFAKVFDVAEAENPTRIDEKKLVALADAWFSEMAGVALDTPEIQNEYLEMRRLAGKRVAGP